MSASTAKSDFNKIEFFITLALGFVFAFGLSWAGQIYPSLVLCLICMMIFGWRRYSQAAKSQDAVSLEVFGDQVYLLGYLFTIAAILGVFLQPGSSAADELIHAGALKLATTVVGLMVMCSFKETARLWNQEEAFGIKDENERLSSEVREAVRILVADLTGLREKLNELTLSFDTETPSRFAAFAKHLSLITDALPGMHLAMEKTTEMLNSLNPQVLQLDVAIVSARERGVEPMTARLEAYGAAATAVDAGLRGASDSAQGFSHAMQTLLNEAERAGPQMTEFTQHLRTTAQVIPKLNTAVGKTTERLEGLHPEVSQLNSALVAAREQGVEPLAEGLQSIVATSTSAGNGLESVHKSAQRLGTALQELGAHTDADGVRIRSINETFSRLSQAFAELDNYLQSLLRGQIPAGESPLLMLQGVVRSSADTIGLLNEQLVLANDRLDALVRNTPIESSERLSAIVQHLADVSLKLEENNALLLRVVRAMTPTGVAAPLVQEPPSKWKWFGRS
jgi:hypothetical protein